MRNYLAKVVHVASLYMARKKAIGETKSMMTDNNNNINADLMRESKRKIDKAHSADNSHKHQHTTNIINKSGGGAI